MPNFDEMYAFLSEHYLHSRFAGRDGNDWNGKDGIAYSHSVCNSAIASLQAGNAGLISHFEAASGRLIKYDQALTILNKDEPPAQLGKKAGNLTHIYGQSFC